MKVDRAALPQIGDNMNKMIRMICLAGLCFTASLMPVKVRAQSDDDKKFLAMAAQSDQNEIALSKLAVEKATDPAVKAFAEKMIAEHTKMSQGMKPFAESWGLTPPSGPDGDCQKELDKLNKLSEKDFDKEYIDQMVTDHSKALSAFTKEAKDTKDKKFQTVVIQDKTAVAAHKNMAYDLKKKL
jgi:putative membrane protein